MRIIITSILVFILFAAYLAGIYLGISDNKNIHKPDYIFYYDEDYVDCKLLSDVEMYCVFKDVREI